MRILIIIPALFVSLFLGTPSYSADFDKGLTAAQNGDFAAAFKEWKPLAEQGLAKAQFNLGVMYEYGDGVPQDYKEAVRLYRLAAEQGFARAQFNLGVMYEYGHAVPQDYTKAVRLYRLAAEQGFADAQYNLGTFYGNGTGVVQDFVYAHMWLNIAASNGVDKGNKKEIERKLTTSDISEAQKLARECVKKNYKGC